MADATLEPRLAALAIHPTGALWGRGELDTRDAARELEAEQTARFPIFCAGLEKQGLKQERRALRIQVGEVGFEVLDEATLRLAFTLPPGSYATRYFWSSWERLRPNLCQCSKQLLHIGGGMRCR
ncbi:hypothetical protein [Thiothrix caldifontis]|uniref:hypothetical protein n=1 Tax=Thiothrix caldifontis TaxID=525918 RepID=UPI001FE0D12C|nr:hypothetical protein [Thiothrix caldifontis]